MRYYVEINGESSLDIQGLMIQSLPSISKPLMRSKQETIDGRDGDIVTKLGYSAYDKTLKIGLWGNYDINEVIAFFNQEGTITFSNEPDKYYRFTILNREDYVSQLDKFRTCTIALHCQPYKYKLNEEAEELENEYVEQEGTSLSFNNTLVAPMNIDLKGNTLQNGTPTPSSPIPINNVSGDNDIVVFGKNLIDVSKGRLGNWGGLTFTSSSNGELIVNGTNSSVVDVYLYIADQYNIPLVNFLNNKTGTYTLSNDKGYENYFRLTSGFKQNTATISPQDTTINCFVRIPAGTYNNLSIKVQLEQGNQSTTYEAYNGTTYNIDLPVENLIPNNLADGSLNNVSWVVNSDGSISLSGTANARTEPYLYNNSSNPIKFKAGTYINTSSLMIIIRAGSYYSFSPNTPTTINSDISATEIYFRIENGTTTNYTYYPQMLYGSKANSYTPYGTTPIELNKIGTYQDYFYKENDKWYLHKEVGKVVFDGSENWDISTSYTYNVFYRTLDNYARISNTQTTYCEYYNGIENTTGIVDFGNNYNNSIGVRTANDNIKDIYISNNSITSANDFKTWLSIHNTSVYYVLAIPTNTEITYTSLINQLESIKNAMSKEGTTNVNQVNNDAPFIITASVLSGTDSITLTNEGNTTSKPTLTITGSGVVGVYLENIQMFNISLGTNETIIIDTENMEAYYGSQLKNRQVTGDYSNFALQSGTNNLKFTGVVTNVEITNYNRWI